jgi:hypothetical protein
MSSAVRRLLDSPLLFSVALLAGAGAALLVADGVNRPPNQPDLGFVRVDSARTSHVLILLVDSWRHQTAIDSAIMPEVARLSREGASGRVETVFEGFSIPAIRAAFSGTAPTQLMNLIRNFHFRALPIESSFLDASRVGKRALVVGDEPFTQFGPFLEKRMPHAQGLDMYGLDRLRPGIALDAYRSGRYALVVCHYETADWRAHQYGIHSPYYTEAFAGVDSTIAAFARARRPGDYLLVFGDHGHNEAGEHKTGLDIPTHGLFIGPDIRPGVVFPSIPISDMRFIIDHALGIELRAPAREIAQLSQFLPLEGAGAPVAETSDGAAHPSRTFRDYVFFALFLAAFGAATAIAVGSGGRGGRGRWRPSPVRAASAANADDVMTWPNAAIATIFVGELLAQQQLHPAWSAFPFLTLAVGVLAWRADRVRGAVITLIALFFVTRFTLDAGAASLIRAPVGVAALVPLYIAGCAAKFAIVLGAAFAGAPARAATISADSLRRGLSAGVVTAALAMLEFRVWDRPALFIAAIAITALTLFRFRAGAHRRVALVAFGYAVLYFTLRLPLYQYAWVDFFMVAVWLAGRAAPGAWLDALVITGAFALTSVWLPSGLEWGFLYGIFPAYVVELQVGWFVPFILLKIPMLLVLTWWATDTRPSRRFVALMFVYAGVRFVGVWVVRLAGGTGAGEWPMAEQGMYLTTFAIATVWTYRAGVRARGGGLAPGVRRGIA